MKIILLVLIPFPDRFRRFLKKQFPLMDDGNFGAEIIATFIVISDPSTTWAGGGKDIISL